MQQTVILEPPKLRLSVGVTGHRSAHASFAQARERIASVLDNILDQIDAVVGTAPTVFGDGSLAPTRLLTLLADGTDRMAAEKARDRGYELVAPLPFGRRLNKAINALPGNADDARALLAGEDAADPATQEHADAIRRLSDQAHVFSLADQDDAIAALFLQRLDAPGDFAKAQHFTVESSRRVALAGRILIEQSDIVIAVWDGVTTGHVGGTGHTIATALDLGAPVVWINPASPEDWRILRAPESLAVRTLDCGRDERRDDLAAYVRAVFDPGDGDRDSCVGTINGEKWPSSSNRLGHAYRRVETLFGGKSDRSRLRSLKVKYESPDDIASGSASEMLSVVRALPDGEAGFADRIISGALKRFAWADGISTHLSDSYRGGMIVSFILSSLAIVGGIAYIPIVPSSQKWIFALFELLLLCAIMIITFYGQKRRLHGRWFETRRVAEYLRHAPLLLTLGAARAPGRWPQGTETSWPEWYVRHALRDIGLPRVAVTPAYLRVALSGLLDTHVVGQRDYHFDKARRLTTVHHNLDRLSERLFLLAVVSVALFLGLYGASQSGLIAAHLVEASSKYFTVLGVLFPTFGAGIAGIRYFGDFERFAAISEVTAEKLDVIHDRITLLATAPDGALHYGEVAELAHATDEIVFSEIENWQAVFGGKQIAVPV